MGSTRPTRVSRPSPLVPGRNGKSLFSFFFSFFFFVRCRPWCHLNPPVSRGWKILFRVARSDREQKQKGACPTKAGERQQFDWGSPQEKKQKKGVDGNKGQENPIGSAEKKTKNTEKASKQGWGKEGPLPPLFLFSSDAQGRAWTALFQRPAETTGGVRTGKAGGTLLGMRGAAHGARAPVSRRAPLGWKKMTFLCSPPEAAQSRACCKGGEPGLLCSSLWLESLSSALSESNLAWG